MNLANNLRFLQNPTKKDLAALNKVEKSITKWVINPNIVEEYISEILQLFHDGYKVSPQTFIKDIFFPNQLILRATYYHDDSTIKEYKKVEKLIDNRAKQIKLVRIYRSLVSDLFDPYLSILVASVEIVEGNFQSIQLSNLGKTERGKVEFLTKRLKSSSLFSGYSPIIRNAISHSGSHGIIYEDNSILFRQIKRGKNPSIGESLKVSNEELVSYIQKILDFIVSVGASINLFGLDIQDIITKDIKLIQKFQYLISPKQLAKKRKRNDKAFSKIWENVDFSNTRKLEYFTSLFSAACEKNEMQVLSISFKKNFVIISVPWKIIDIQDDTALISRIMELTQYLCLAEMYFHFSYNEFLVEETGFEKERELQFWISGEDLKKYNLKESHPLDIIEDGSLFRNHDYIEINVDFVQLKRNIDQSMIPQHALKAR